MSTLKLPAFEYLEPTTVEEAAGLLATYGDEARVLAGGIDLLPRLRSGTPAPAYLVSIQRIPGLDHIAPAKGGGLSFGALASLHALELCPQLRERFPALYDAIHQITSVQTKYMGTAVGNLCVATPASDLAPALAALDAELTVAGPAGTRRIPVADFYRGYQKTALGVGEFVTGVNIPPAAPGLGVAFYNLVRTHADIAKVTVTAGLVLKDGICTDVRIALGSVAPTMFRAREAEALLEGQKLSDDLMSRAAEKAAAEAKPIDDLRSSAEYRREMVAVLVTRALHKAAERSTLSQGTEVTP